MKDHECTNLGSCLCSRSSLEPNEDCPIHGYPDPRRCTICGRYFKVRSMIEQMSEDLMSIFKKEEK